MGIYQITSYVSKNLILTSWILAIGAMAGSLVLSEVLGFVPCKLCWYQRVFLFSAIIALGIAEYYKYVRAYRFVLPLTILGGTIALYHTLLQWGLVPEGSITCNINASCAIKQFNYLGFVTIPFLYLSIFISLTVLM